VINRRHTITMSIPLSATDALRRAREGILAPAGLDEGRIEQALGLVLGSAVDAADLYFQLARAESWGLEDGIVKEGSASIEQGVGVRAMAGEKTGFAYSDEIMMPALEEAARAARAIAVQRGSGAVQAWHPVSAHQLYLPIDPLLGLADEDKIAWLERIDRETRRMDPRIVQVMASVVAQYELVLIATSDGVLAGDVRPLVRMNVTVIAEHNGRREQGYAGCGGRYSLDQLVAHEQPLVLAREAVRQALVNLEAVPAPAGTMTVVLGPGWPGVCCMRPSATASKGISTARAPRHSAIASASAWPRPVARSWMTGRWPSGAARSTSTTKARPTQCTMLIEDGVLRGYMQDRLNARLMGSRSTGNGRRESFAHMTIPRMTNTYMRAGPHDPGEIIASVQRGIYAVNFGGGQVDITSGKFVFSASEAYLIENGKLGRRSRARRSSAMDRMCCCACPWSATI
jgi:TldD protein